MSGKAFSAEELDLIAGALSAQLRYARTNLDRAKEPDAIDRWARLCVSLRDLLRKVSNERRWCP